MTRAYDLIVIGGGSSGLTAARFGAVDGFIKIVHLDGGTILGATVVSARAGEIISEFSLAMKHGLTVRDVAEALHVYPTYSMPVMQLSAEVATE